MGLLLGHIDDVRGETKHGSDALYPSTAAPSSSSSSNANTTTTTTKRSMPSDTGAKIATIYATHIIERSVQRSDRVEVAPESLLSATEAAEQLSTALGCPLYVIGWYHSHPKIPVVPSAVDLGSQKAYQQHVESAWVGLIVSNFNTDAAMRSHCAMHCFQAGPNNEHLSVPLQVVSQMHFLTTPPQLLATPDLTPLLLTVLQKEVENAMLMVKEQTRGDGASMRAAQGLQEMQLYSIDRLVAEPVKRYLELYSIPSLAKEVARLEAELGVKGTP